MSDYIPPSGNAINFVLDDIYHVAGDRVNFLMEYGDPVPLIEIRTFLNQVYELLEPFDIVSFINQKYNLTTPVPTLSLIQKYSLSLVQILKHAYSSADTITTFLYQFYSSDRTVLTFLEQVYGEGTRVNSFLTQIWDVMHNPSIFLNQGYNISEKIPVKSLNQKYDLNQLNITLVELEQKWSIFSGSVLSNNITYGITIDGVPVPSENVNVDCDIDRYYIEASFTLSDPRYLPLCKKKAEVVITISVGTDSQSYSLLLWERSRNITTASTYYTLTCRSKSVLLDSKYTPNLQKEFSPDLASNIITDLAAICGVPVIWNLYDNGTLIDETILAGYLFANNEKPLAVIRRVLEALGGIMQSTPDGSLEIIHSYPNKVPNFETDVPDILLNTEVRYQSISSTYEERLGINTVHVSDQLTSDSSFSLEEKEISSTEKYVKGFHTPWDSQEVILDTSGGSTVRVDYLGVVTETIPEPTEDVPYELVEFVNGTGNTSKPIYGIISTSWVMDVLGGIISSEDGTLVSDVLGESLLKIVYTTKYHLWKVTSPSVSDVQCILRPKP